MKNIFKATIALGLIGTSLSAPLQAQAGGGQVAQTRHVQLADLDVSDRQDLEVLRSRIDMAVRKVCPNRFEGPVKKYPDPRRCRAEAWQDAEQQLGIIIARVEAGKSAPARLAIATVKDSPS